MFYDYSTIGKFYVSDRSTNTQSNAKLSISGAAIYFTAPHDFIKQSRDIILCGLT